MIKEPIGPSSHIRAISPMRSMRPISPMSRINPISPITFIIYHLLSYLL